MEIIKATLNELDTVSELFDLYRVFYNQKPNIEDAKKFLSERIINNDSEIYLAINDKDEGMGFVQLFPKFSSVSMKNSGFLMICLFIKIFASRELQKLLLKDLYGLQKKQTQKDFPYKRKIQISARKNFMIRKILLKTTNSILIS